MSERSIARVSGQLRSHPVRHVRGAEREFFSHQGTRRLVWGCAVTEGTKRSGSLRANLGCLARCGTQASFRTAPLHPTTASS